MGLETIKSLECLVQKNNAEKAVITLHGFGANMHDLAPIADAINSHKSFDWYNPDAPLKAFDSPFFPSKAWFPIAIEKFEALENGQSFESLFTPEMVQAMNRATEMVCELCEYLRPKYKQLFLGGFSQGSMVALDVATELNWKPDGLFLLSSAPNRLSKWKNQIEQLKDINCLQTHGTMDPVLPYSWASELKDFLSVHTKYQFQDFAGGHEIPLSIIHLLGEFLNGR